MPLIFEGLDLWVSLQVRETREIFITFSSYHPRKCESDPFGEGLFGPQRISSLVFVSRWNHWWQTQEMDHAIPAVCSALTQGGFDTRIGYGSSMGGYGILHYSQALSIDRLFAISPQFTADPRKVPWDRRFPETAEINFCRDDMAAGISRSADILLAYDPLHRIDRKHCDLIRDARHTDAILSPFAGHPAGTFLQEINLLKTLALRQRDVSLDWREARQTVRQSRYKSPHYFARMEQGVATRRSNKPSCRKPEIAA